MRIALVHDYIKEYGRRHFGQIVNKVEKSNSVRRYLIKIQEINMPPLCDDLIATIMNMPYFMIAKKETVAVASILLLQKWRGSGERDPAAIG